MAAEDAELERRILSITRGHVPGVSIAVVGPEGERWLRSFGVSDLRTGVQASPDTAYLWFSMTKIVTATAAMLLVDRGALGLDDRVVERYPPFARMQPSDRAARVTVRHLLSHSSGIANPIPVRWVHPASKPPPDQARSSRICCAGIRSSGSNPARRRGTRTWGSWSSAR